MRKDRKKTEKLRYLPTDSLFPNPWAARRRFAPPEMESLTASVARYGILEPLLVQKKPGGEYEILSGEKRLRAAKSLEMKTVPCRVLCLSPKAAAEISLVENLQRGDLDDFEEAAAAMRLSASFRYYQGELARRLGQSPSVLAAKMRLLRFSPEERDLICDNALSSRHADALLHLHDPAMRLFALQYITENRLPPDRAEELCRTLARSPEEFIPSLRPGGKPRPRPVRRLVVKDVRLFLNSVDRAILSIREAGYAVEAEKEDHDSYITYSIRIPKYDRS